MLTVDKIEMEWESHCIPERFCMLQLTITSVWLFKVPSGFARYVMGTAVGSSSRFLHR